MTLVMPIYVSLAQQVVRSRMIPPYVSVEKVGPEDSDFEDVVYNISGGFIRNSHETASEVLLLQVAIARETNWLELPFASNKNNTDMKNQEDLKRWVAEVLIEPEFAPLDKEKSELWLIHGEKSEEAAIKLTSGLLQSPIHRSYDGARLQGMLSINESNLHLAIPVYLWLEYGMDSIGALVDNFEDRNMRARVPVDWEPIFEYLVNDEAKSEYEERIWSNFEVYLSERGVSVFEPQQEPNGDATFPDWRASIEFLGKCDVEITRMSDGLIEPRLMQFGRDPLNPEHDSRIVRALSNAKFGESALHRAVSDVLTKKAAKKSEVQSGNRYVLFLVNDIFPALEPWFRIWDGHDYSGFDYVFLANRDFKTKEYSFHLIYPDPQPNPYQSEQTTSEQRSAA